MIQAIRNANLIPDLPISSMGPKYQFFTRHFSFCSGQALQRLTFPLTTQPQPPGFEDGGCSPSIMDPDPSLDFFISGKMLLGFS